MKKLSVIICTYNRSNILRLCIESLLINNRNVEDYEIVVVDNNSTDNTRELIEGFSLSVIKYVFEEKQGLSNARNRGIKEANYKYIAFIDDDTVVEKDFVKNILEYFKEDKNVCGGGKIYSIWEEEKPSWFKENFYSIIGETKYGEENRKLVGNEYPYGGNMFFNKEIFKDEEEVFNPSLGVQGNEIKMGEEVEVCEKIRNKGYDLCYLSNVVVGHRVHMNKVNKEYVEKRWTEEGRAYGKIISGNGKKAVIKQGILRLSIILLRDLPKAIGCTFKKTDFDTLYKTQLTRSLEVLKNLKL